MKTLVAFGTKWGSTEEVAKELASLIEGAGHEVQLLDLRDEKDVNLEPFDMVVLGSGIAYGSWSKGAVRFLDGRSEHLSKKRLAMFACCGDLLFDPSKADEYERKYLMDVATKYGLSPVSAALFGGVLDFNKYSFLVKGILNMRKAGRKDMEERGVDISKPYDFRDWDSVRRWGMELGKVK